jgi:hypothetical protein
MKYKANVKSEQFVQIDEKTMVKIKPEGGDMPDAHAKAVAKTAWGKRLIETGCLVFPGKVQKTGDDNIPDFDGGGEAA